MAEHYLSHTTKHRTAPYLAGLLLLLGGCGLEDSPDSTCVPETDLDGDGICVLDDCDDGSADVGSATEWYEDADGDGYGKGPPVESCEAPANSASFSGDCNDSDPQVNPSAQEVCDGIDNNCDGQKDELPSCECVADCSPPSPTATPVVGTPTITPLEIPAPTRWGQGIFDESIWGTK